MMLYVFHVDMGAMRTFDMRLVSESVGSLKEQIEKVTGIAVDKQVLLISGGECLDASSTICSYAAGTDTNPIFLFSKAVIESTGPPQAGAETMPDDLADRIKEALDMAPSYATVQKRAALAQLLYERGKDQQQTCERLVHDQHLQQQGWSAVVANLDDITQEFSNRAKIFKEFYGDFLKVRDTYMGFLKDFREDLETLRQIPALPVLFEPEEKQETSDLESSKAEDSAEAKLTTLYDWISHSEDAMDQLYDHCERGLEQFSEMTCHKTLSELEDVLIKADNQQMKEVKGLGERLSGLENLMREAKRILQEQNENAKSFHMNLTRVSNLKDTSILPDLCTSHRKQLQQMAANHQRMVDIRSRCAKAKEELSVNLFHRLKWVMFVEDNLMRQDDTLMVHHDCLKSLKRHLDVLQQIHLTPAMYLSAVAEVVRRRKFSQTFLLWASDVACQLLAIHNNEVARRKEFQGQFEGHFLNSLFPGLGDVPPSFATEAPQPFDQQLPRISQEDVDRLREQLPHFAEYLQQPDTSTFTNFFMLKSLVRTELDKVEDGQDIKDVESKLVQVVQGVGLASNLDNKMLQGTGSESNLATTHGLAHLRDIDRGCESETDTEEFEKVGQSPLEPSPRPPSGTQDASTSTEDNLQISRSEHDRLKGTLECLGQLSTQALAQLQGELKEMKTLFMSDISVLESGYKSLSTSFHSLVQESAKAEKTAADNLASAHEAELSSMKNMYREKEDELGNVKIANIVLDQKFQRTCEELAEIKAVLLRLKEEHVTKVEQLQKDLAERELDKDRTVKELQDRLTREHKAEMENIRSRFKLMMERSPSDTNLEKIGDFGSIPNHESILLQMSETFEMNREKLVKETIEQEKDRWLKVLEEQQSELERRHEEDKQSNLEEVARKINEEKDKQIDILRERERNLNLEIIKYKSTIQQLTEADVVTSSLDMRRQIDQMRQENEALKEELDNLRMRQSTTDMTASVAVLDALPTVAESDNPMAISTVESMCESTTSSVSKKTKTYKDRCPKGCKVDIIWDEEHYNFRCDLDGKLYFVHCDCLPVMNLKVVDGKPNVERTVAEVIDKEFCLSKKDDNRYNVPKGHKFFRVKVKPISATPALEEEPKLTEPEEIRPESVEKNFYHDSGVVEELAVEEAAVALDNLSETEKDDRFTVRASHKLALERPRSWFGRIFYQK